MRGLRRESGFTLVELLIVMAIFVVVIALSASTFTQILGQSKQQAKTAESQIEGLIGLELLRLDIEHAGYGLPWSFQNAIVYTEAASGKFNDSPNPPRAILSGNDISASDYSHVSNILANTDYLVIKSAAIGSGETAQRWNYLMRIRDGASDSTCLKKWGSGNITNGEQVIVINAKAGESAFRQLVMNGGTYYTTYYASTDDCSANYKADSGYVRSNVASSFAPIDSPQTFTIYGVASDNLVMPFNRADYYVRRPSTKMPSLCAPGTGILYKATVNHTDRNLFEMPLLDCVADMQVIFRRDTNNDGAIDDEIADLAGMTAQQIRDQVREVRVYILAHEGQMDRSYTFNKFTTGACATCVRVGEFGLGRDFDLAAITNYQNYRWRVHRLIVKPKNLK